MQELPKLQGELKCRGTEAGDVNVGTKYFVNIGTKH